MNRLIPRIEHVRDCLARRVRIDNGKPLPASLDLTQWAHNLDNSPLEHFAFQNAQARAHAKGLITTDEAQTIYMALGEVPASDGWASGTDLATKLIVTEVMAEIMAGRSPQARR